MKIIQYVKIWTVNKQNKTPNWCPDYVGIFFFFFRERGGGREKDRERKIDQLPLVHTKTGDQTCNPGMCPENQTHELLIYGPMLKPSEAHHPGQWEVFLWNFMNL